MTTYPDALQGVATAQMTFAAVRDRILADETLPLVRRQEMASALTRLAKALGLPADILLADPVDLRARLKGLEPAMVRIQPPRWKNILSLTRAALTHVGICQVPNRFEGQPSAAWTHCLNLLLRDDGRFRGDQKDQNRFLLGRFARYCTLIGIEPDQVDDAVLARFLEDLTRRSLVDHCERAARDTAVRWNRVAAAMPDWPQQRLTVADNRNDYAVPWDRFPASLKQDVDAWLARLASGPERRKGSRASGPRPRGKPRGKKLAPASLILRRKQMHLYLSALVLKGEDPDTMVDLASVVTLDRVDLGIRFFLERTGKEQSLHAGQIAVMLLTCARHWIKASEEVIEGILNTIDEVMPETGVMTDKNEALLDQLKDPEKLRALLTLSETILGEAKRGVPSKAMACCVQTALMIQILINAPIRMKNLTELKIGENLQPLPQGEIRLYVPKEKVKNGQPINIRLRGETVRLLERYLKVDRPLLAQPGSPYLFPGITADRPKTPQGMRVPMQAMLAKRCGLKWHPHLFRHMAGFLILEDNPAAAAIAQRILGHKRMETTERFYLSRKTEAAFNHYDTLLKARQAGGSIKPQGCSGRKRG